MIPRMPTATLAASRRCSTVGVFRRASRCRCIRPSRLRLSRTSRPVSAEVLSESLRVPGVRTVFSHSQQFELQILSNHRQRARRGAGVGSAHGRGCIASSSRTELFMMCGDDQMLDQGAAANCRTPRHLSRRAIYHQLMAEGTNFLVAHDEHRFVFANLRFAGHQQRAIVYVRRGRVARQEDEVRVAVALAVNVHAIAWPGPLSANRSPRTSARERSTRCNC